jgi:flagellar capping protein FliD
MEDNIWITGPVELLNHGIKHIKETTGDDNFDFRIAMISIDNAVEATLKTYITLNRRTLRISYKEFKDAIRKFPAMLDLLFNHCQEKISADELDGIDMFHIIRNNLYHQGIGINVDREIVERYSVVAGELISRLFDVELGKDFEIESVSDISSLYGEFLIIWRDIEVNLKNFALVQELIPQVPRPLTIKNILTTLFRNELIEEDLANDIFNILSFRNNIVHNRRNYTAEKMKELITQIKEIKSKVLNLIQKI